MPKRCISWCFGKNAEGVQKRGLRQECRRGAEAGASAKMPKGCKSGGFGKNAEGVQKWGASAKMPNGCKSGCFGKNAEEVHKRVLRQKCRRGA
ncbi:MAG: hypothetical protein KBT04_06695 [Bacteroidales bacterium]|nr:hypothetical protein [Candidatus Colimorpha onthohippi]